MRHILFAAMVLAAPAAHAGSDFVMRAGEWESSIQFAGKPNAHPVVHHICQLKDHTLNAAAMNASMAHMKGTSCTDASLTTAGDVTTYSFACSMGALHMQLHGTITRNGPDAYTTHAMEHAEGGPTPIQDLDMVNSSRRLGPCQPGDTPERDLGGGPS